VWPVVDDWEGVVHSESPIRTARSFDLSRPARILCSGSREGAMPLFYELKMPKFYGDFVPYEQANLAILYSVYCACGSGRSCRR
jgi:hypothetical protein